jgi:hypothetical protein
LASAETQAHVIAWKPVRGGPKTSGCPSPQQALTLVARRETGFTVRRTFCSADGKAKADTVDDAFDQTFVLVERAEGRTPTTLNEYLVVYRMSDKMIPRAHIKISEGVGAHVRWRYDYRVNRPAAGGLEIVLTLAGPSQPGVQPDETTKLVRVSKD